MEKEISLQGSLKHHTMTHIMVILTAIISGLTPRYFPFPQPTSASTLPGGSEDRKRQTRGQGEWRVLLKCEAMASYTRCTYSSSRCAASAWQQGSEGGDGGEAEGAEGALWLSQAEGKAGERGRRWKAVEWRVPLHSAKARFHSNSGAHVTVR